MKAKCSQILQIPTAGIGVQNVSVKADSIGP